MSDDADLTAFGSDAVNDDPDAGGSDDAGEGDDGGADRNGEPEADPEVVEEPTYTYTSTPDGSECAACSAVVEERWRAGEGGVADDPDLDPDALVCPDCKEW